MQWFCLALQPLLVSANEALKSSNGMAVAFADDVCLVGPVHEVFSVFDKLSTKCANIGLRIQPTKCKVLAPTEQLCEEARQFSIDRAFGQLPAQAIMILGTPVGEPMAEYHLAMDITGKNIYEPLNWIKDLQCRMILLRYCIVARFQHLSRTMVPDVARDCLLRLDDHCRRALASILGDDDIADRTWLEATLPISLGGFGIKCLADQCEIDFYASASTALLFWRNHLSASHPMIANLISGESHLAQMLHQSLEYCKQLTTSFHANAIIPTQQDPASPERRLERLRTVTLPADIRALFKGPTPDCHKLQGTLSKVYSRIHFRMNWRSLDLYDMHRIQVLAKTTGTPQLALQALPTEPGFCMSNAEFRLMLRQLIGLDLPQALGLNLPDMECCCNTAYPRMRKFCTPQHLFNCQAEQAFTKRHDAILNVVAAAFRSVSINPSIERTTQAVRRQRANGSQVPPKRFDIVAPPADDSSRSMCMDITVTSHTTREYFAQACKKPLVNVANAITQKRTKYADDLNQDTEVFVPLVCETSGAIHTNYHTLFVNIGNRVNGVAPMQAFWVTPNFTSYWMQRVSVVLWRETAQSLLRIAAKAKLRSGRLGEDDEDLSSSGADADAEEERAHLHVDA